MQTGQESMTLVSCFQFKIIHGILPTNKGLFKMGLKTSPRCERCNCPNETLIHLLYECPTPQSFWYEAITWWNEKRSENISLNASDILYGYKPDCTKFHALNHVLIIAKYHIFQAWLQTNSPCFEIFFLVIKDKILCERRIGLKKQHIFEIQIEMDNFMRVSPAMCFYLRCTSCPSVLSALSFLVLLPFFHSLCTISK